ncbi:MAG: hypothetical protein KGM16_17110 [Bacteroidota bacterium]|nr:hypothetical protein [Bacteroidota bacterium]
MEAIFWRLANSYIEHHYKTAKFGDVAKVLDVKGKTSYIVEINRKDVIFDTDENFVKSK